MHNLYQILEISKDASPSAIKKAYRNKALSEHPDKGGDAQKMALLTKAYRTLIDGVERKKFDQEWEVFNASEDSEIPSKPTDHLPTAGIAFSKTFKQQHEQFIKQCCLNPLSRNQSSSYLKAFSSDLYSCDSNDLFSFIKTKENSELGIYIGVLSPEKAVGHFINFLRGDYYGNNLKDLSKAFYQKIKQLETSQQQADSEYKLYCGIYEIFLVAVKKRTPTAKILFSLHKITEYAKHNVDQTIDFMVPLLQSKYFRNLFSQALHYYWLSDESGASDESYTKAFDGQEAAKSLIESLKAKLSESRMTNKSNEEVVKSLRNVRLLLKLESDLCKSADVPTAVFYREKAFHLLDWLPAIRNFAEHAISVNTLLQIGITLQKAAAHEQNPILRMADEKLAAKIYITAVGVGHHAKPDVELYACLHSVKFLLSCHYNDSESEEILKAVQHRGLWIADLFPFFQVAQSNADYFVNKDKLLGLMRQLLHTLIGKIEDQEHPVEIDHSYVRILYQAYEACLKNWYHESCDPETEKKFRQRLMQELLKSKQWTIENLDNNLKAPWPLIDLDDKGWTCHKSSILSSAKKINAPTYKTIQGVEFNFNQSGDINFILDYCEDSENDATCLLTSFDLSELFELRLMSSFFSLDPVDPNMPYHPFNQMHFGPSTLHNSHMLHTMLITDYLLKFLTVGQEVQRRSPYELRSLDELMSRLPDHLKKVIYDFHVSNHEESVHRFWIESGEMEFAIDDSEYGKSMIAVGNMPMVVKHRKMKRDAEGNLIDKEGENEGWNCYVFNQEQEKELYNRERTIKDSALIIIEGLWELIFWENQKVTHRFTLDEDRQDLILLSKLQRDSQEKVKNDDSESLRQIYRVVTKAAEKTRVLNGYSPEFIFAQEFTKYYDQFAVYFPEFGRLRELSKAVYLVRIMASMSKSNQEQINLIEKQLKCYKESCGLQSEQPSQVQEYNYWQTVRQKLKELVNKHTTKQFEEWRSKFSKEKFEQKRQEQLNDLKRQIGTLPGTGNSVLTFLQKQHYCGQILKLLEDELVELPAQSARQLINKFLEGDNRPLCEHLVHYDRNIIAKKIKEVYPEQTIETLDSALNRFLFAINKIVDCETEKSLIGHEQQLNALLIGRKKLKQSFTDLDFGDDIEEEELDLAGNCLWVPASFRHDIEGRNSRTVYGGVSICPKLRECVKDGDRQALLRQTHASGKQLQKNRLAGNAACTYFKRYMVEKYYNSPQHIVKEQYYVPTPLGKRFLDVVVIDRDTNKVVKAFEVKIGKSAKSYEASQRAKDKWMYDAGVIVNPVKLRHVRLDPNFLSRFLD